MVEFSSTYFIVFLVAICGCLAQDVIVDIPTMGSVRGSQKTSAFGRTFRSFRRIPFAQPPVGDLRFQDPVPANTWGRTILDGTQESPACIQYNSMMDVVTGEEDCLYLNVYTPELNTSSTPLPVMVWIHGGAFYIGSGNGDTDRFGPGYFLDRDVVLVTFNYRLGPLGFLSTEDVEAPGNYALLDQSLALRWVRNHISHFGGNPDLVTLFGESAGGGSVDLQVLSPYSKGLFHRAIVQSGMSTCPWAVQTSVGEYTQFLAKHLDCPTANSRELLACLRTKSAADIVAIRKHFALDIGYGMFPFAFVPRVDKERQPPFLPAAPEELITQGNFNHVPMIVGVVQNEGSVVSSSFHWTGKNVLEEFKADPIGVVTYMLIMEKQPNIKLSQYVHDQYLSSSKPYEGQLKEIEMISSDYGVFKCTDDTVKLYSIHSDEPIYYYYYSHRGQFTFPQLVGISPEIEFGVCHADELFLMFTSGFLPLISISDDIKVSKILLDLWTSFAENGAPQSQLVEDRWMPVEKAQVRYLGINAKRPTLVRDNMPFHRRLAFWDGVKERIARLRDEL